MIDKVSMLRLIWIFLLLLSSLQVHSVEQNEEREQLTNAPKQDFVMKAGERFIIPTFTEDIIALTVQPDGNLQVEPYLILPRMGSISMIDVLPDGRLAMAGFYTQLLLYDEQQDELTTLTDFPTPIDWDYINLRAEGTIGVFESTDPIDGIRRMTWLGEFTDELLSITPVDLGFTFTPSLSFDGTLMAVTIETPLDTSTMTGRFRHIHIFPVDNLTIGDEIFLDKGEGHCFGAQFHPINYQIAYLCDNMMLVIYDIENETRQEFDVEYGRCVRWSPEGGRVVMTILPIQADPFYKVIDLETGTSQILTIPDDTPDYDDRSICPAWLGSVE